MANKKLEQKIGFAEARITEEQNRKASNMLNLYSQEIKFLEDIIIKTDNYKSTGQEKQVQLVDSALTKQGMIYLGFM